MREFLGIRKHENVAAAFSTAYMCCGDIFKQNARVPTLSQLVDEVSRITAIPVSTVFAYGRFAREAGLIAQGGRGKGGAEMQVTDAANLLIALGGTDVAREGPAAIRAFRELSGTAVFVHTPLATYFRNWLKPVGGRTRGTTLRIVPNFGEFVEWLILQGQDGGLERMLRETPTTDVPSGKWNEWCERYPYGEVDKAVADQFLRIKPADKVVLGEDVQLQLVFDRTGKQADVEIARDWTGLQDILIVRFIGPPGFRPWGGYRTTAVLTQSVILDVGKVLGASS